MVSTMTSRRDFSARDLQQGGRITTADQYSAVMATTCATRLMAATELDPATPGMRRGCRKW